MYKLGILSLVFLLAMATAIVLGQSGGGFDLSWSTIDGGGGNSSGGSFSLSGSIGQPDAAALSGGDFVLDGGFWQCVTTAVTSPTITTDGTDIELSWTSNETSANIYRAKNDPYFTATPPALAGSVSSPWTDSGAAGDPATNYTYIIRADGRCGESADSQRLAEFDFAITSGS